MKKIAAIVGGIVGFIGILVIGVMMSVHEIPGTTPTDLSKESYAIVDEFCREVRSRHGVAINPFMIRRKGSRKDFDDFAKALVSFKRSGYYDHFIDLTATNYMEEAGLLPGFKRP